jgi:aldehyde dehydrogenase (NAD+)
MTELPAPYEGFGRMPLAGSWRQGRSGTKCCVHDPFSGETLLEILLADARDIDEAYRAAAASQPAWEGATPQERRDVIERAARIAEARKDEIVGWLIKEAGTTRTTAPLEWKFFHDQLLDHATYPFHAAGRIVPSAVRGKESRVYRRPVGVVSVITPWNFPLHLSTRAVGPAIAVGNAVVLKPSTETPITGGLLLAKIFEEAGLPAGVLSVVVGKGSDIGDAFVDHPVPRVVSFTGSTAVGRHVGERCGRNLKRACLELGGNGPFIVLDDADLELAVDAAVAGKFMHQGQMCVAINRILVDAKVHDRFLERFTKRVAALPAGDPSETNTVIGPIINRCRLDDILQKVDDTIAAGARVVLRGQVSGLVLSPIVLADVTNEMPAAREELFGPVAPVLRFDGEEEAIKIANDTEYGLSSAVFTRDVERGLRVAHRIQAGMTHVNDWPLDDEVNAPFGGEKASGLGRFGGEWALDELTTHQWISVQETPRRYPI